MRGITLFLYLIIIALVSLSAYAEVSITTATVGLTKINVAPQMKSVSIDPPGPYDDSMLLCNAVVLDEEPESVNLHYTWYRNSVKMDYRESYLKGLHANDVLSCEIIPEDNYNEFGQGLRSNEVVIQKSPATMKVITGFINLMGGNADTAELTEASKSGLGSITGYTVSELGQSNRSTVLLFGFVIFVFITNMIFLMRQLRNKSEV